MRTAHRPVSRCPAARLSRLTRAVLAAAAALAAPWPLHAQEAGGVGRVGAGQPDGEALPITVRARRIEGRPDIETVAEGEVELTRGPVSIRADQIRYDHPRDLARARGNVLVTQDGNRYSGPELELQTESYEGFFASPSYYFGLLGAGGQAERVDFLGQRRLAATGATWSSCTPDDEGSYAWLLRADRVRFDFENNEGVAEGAVLRFYDVPILAVPWLSFPLGEGRKSGWLPPTLNLDSKSGFEVAVPYYWNIAPNLDATFTPALITKRGAALGSEFRYLTPDHAGEAGLFAVPRDNLTGSERHALSLDHRGALPADVQYRFWSRRVSDDAYWKDFSRGINDFPRGSQVLTPRLLPTDGRLDWQRGGWSLYARGQDWQVLQDPEALIDAPYARAPQIGARLGTAEWARWRFDFESEFNRFEHPDAGLVPGKVEGSRVHAIGAVSRRFGDAGWYVTPRLSFNAASYSLDSPMADGRREAARMIPGVSVDSGAVFERDAEWFGRRYLQTLEPRLLYVNRPYRAQQLLLPNFDSAPLDENFYTIFSENAFSGVDRVSDAHQLTAGATTRYVAEGSGAEALRLGIVQRMLLRDQRITGTGVPYTDRFGDLLVLGSTGLVPDWNFGGTLQYHLETQSVTRSIFSVRYSPGPFRTVGANYRFAKDASEQLDIGWQWPVYGQARGSTAGGGGTECAGAWYSVGRVNFSARERRLVDSILGFEYDSGCWIGRLVAVRTSTGQREATTRLMFQLEFVGLSRLGSNPLGVLRANIPGYQLLREETRRPTGTPVSYE
ncbi:LPS-assembly protein LptD [Caldimonas tepidiphila]|uniref:LPS-assembly protein LptD n=1 Tax=Caldimonas tepidiphila TaxID=2315841 RepID=UPI001F0CBAAD|nr:LPS assembly protein LptD [Caldimonas tepidiphila]